MAKKLFTHSGNVRRSIDFGKVRTFSCVFRETKFFYISEWGEKYRKTNGRCTSGYLYKGMFFGDILDLSSVSLLKESVTR